VCLVVPIKKIGEHEEEDGDDAAGRDLNQTRLAGE
jgi:hypothetical protein